MTLTNRFVKFPIDNTDDSICYKVVFYLLEYLAYNWAIILYVSNNLRWIVDGEILHGTVDRKRRECSWHHIIIKCNRDIFEILEHPTWSIF